MVEPLDRPGDDEQTFDMSREPAVPIQPSPLPALQSKPVTPASRLVAPIAPLVAFELGLRILAAGPAPQPTLLLLAVPVLRQIHARTGRSRAR